MVSNKMLSGKFHLMGLIFHLSLSTSWSMLSLHAVKIKCARKPSQFSLFSTANMEPGRMLNPNLVRVAYQGEPGAYSEKATRELLGPRVTTVPYESFESAFRAVAASEVDYAVVPIENSLGGSIHTNYDLLMRYDLHIIAEHEFKVEHSLMALPGVKMKDIKKVMSHPQALAQCDNYLRGLNLRPEPAYDTAGAAKLIKEEGLKNCAAIASDLAAKTYGLEVLEANIEDYDINFTRFLLLSRSSVSSIIPPSLPAKTSIVFVVPNQPGGLYKAMACFSLRDIDLCKIESRPTSVDLLQRLKMKGNSGKTLSLGSTEPINHDVPRFSYSFHLDFLASEFDDRAQNALHHLREQSQYVRVLGSFPKNGELIGPIKSALATLANLPITTEYPSVHEVMKLKDKLPKKEQLKIGIIGFGNFGQYIAKTFAKSHTVYAVSQGDKSKVAKEIGCEDFFPLYDLVSFMELDLDVIVFSVSIISFENVLQSIPRDLLSNKLIVDVLSVKVHPKMTMLQNLPLDSDILCTHPMFGPESGKHGWQGLPFLFDKVRVRDFARCEKFLSIWEKERCKMIEMTCEQHDEYAANSQFITHLTGRILGQQDLKPTPIDTKGFQTVLKLVENTCQDSFELFFGLYHYNKYAENQLQSIREALAKVERQLAAKEAYLKARSEVNIDQRNRILQECRAIMREALSDYPIMSAPPPTSLQNAASTAAQNTSSTSIPKEGK